MPKFIQGARYHARVVAMQSLYAWFHTQAPLQESKLHLLATWDVSEPIDQQHLTYLLETIPERHVEIDNLIVEYGQRPLSQITPVERAILSVAICELLTDWAIPIQVILNESIELAKAFGADNSHKFVNGVLDRVATHVRPALDK